MKYPPLKILVPFSDGEKEYEFDLNSEYRFSLLVNLYNIHLVGLYRENSESNWESYDFGFHKSQKELELLIENHKDNIKFNNSFDEKLNG